MPINHEAMKKRQVAAKPQNGSDRSLEVAPTGSHIRDPELYYHPKKKDYFHPDCSGNYICVNAVSAQQYLIAHGFSDERPEIGGLSAAEEEMLAIRHHNSIDYVGALAGYPIGPRQVGPYRVLVTHAATPIKPKPGNWQLLHTVLHNCLGSEQLNYFFGWLKQAMEMYREASFIPGHILGLCGPANSGKTLVKSLIVELVGGREAQPHLFMSGGSEFNSQLFESEILTIDDEAESIDGRSRAKFASAIKRMAVSDTHMCHPKGCAPLSLEPLWRVIVCVNDEPEAMQVLPPLKDGVIDKIMLLKFEKHPMPMTSNTAAERKAFGAALTAELPALAHYVQGWQIPPELSEPRFGIAAYHHPDLLAALNETSPEHQLLGMIDKVLFPTEQGPDEWTGYTEDLYDLLTNGESPCAGRARAAFRYMNTFGAALAALGRQFPKRFDGYKTGGYKKWTIRRKESDAGTVGPKAEKQAVMQRLRDALAASKAAAAGEADKPQQQ